MIDEKDREGNHTRPSANRRRFYAALQSAVSEAVARAGVAWENLTPDDRRTVFERAVKRTREWVLHKRYGGGADDGLSLSTFGRYVADVKRALIFRVPLAVAERATTHELLAARHSEDC